MKLLKKILWVGATLSAFAGFSLTAASCKKDGDKNNSNSTESSSSSSSPEEENNGVATSYVYRVSLQNETGFGFSGVTVNLMDGDEVVATKTTNPSGNANFDAEDVEVGKYTISIANIPAGYAFTDPDRAYETAESSGTKTLINLTPTGVIKEEAPAKARYRLGDVVHDFTVQLGNGDTFTLSQVLEEKKLVLINFWATWCGPCKSEFPSMHDATIAYEDDVAVLAIGTDETESLTEVQNFMTNAGYDLFNVASVAGDATASRLWNAMSLGGGIPQSVMIDRYGVVVFDEIGSMPSVSEFTNRFNRFVGEDYVPTVLGGALSEDDTPSGPENNRIEPTFTAPSASDLKAAVTTADFTFRFQEEEGVQPDEESFDKYNWPWLISEDKSYIYASNANVNNSYAILYSKYTAKEGDVLVFDYKVGSEQDCDMFYVMLDGQIIKRYSGDHAKNWNTSYAYVFRGYEAGEHEISFVFLKDNETMANEDVVQIKNLRIVQESSLAGSTEDISIFRQAATNPTTDKNATKQFQNYVDVVLNETDEYYHVGNANGPVLYANMMNATSWNTYALWTLAYSDYVVGEGMNFKGAIEDFAWEATQVTTVNGYTPVTEDLYYLLDAAVRYVSFGEKFAGKYQDEKEGLDYHAQEWLELCVYWEDYGTPDEFNDPMAGITFTAAIPLKAGTEENPQPNSVSIPYKINPRGFKYKFTPTAEEAGAYRVYSTGKEDTIVFLVGEDRKTQLGYFDSKIGAAETDNNFEFFWHFEAGKTYYLLFTTYLDKITEYDVYLDYLGTSYTYKANAAMGPYSANLNTFELFLPDAISYDYYDDTDNGVDDGFYYQTYIDERGVTKRGGKIYLDVLNTTALFNSTSLYLICKEALTATDEDTGELLFPKEKRALYVEEQYIDGKYIPAHDYTEDFWPICYDAFMKDDAFVPVTKDIFEMLHVITRSSKYEGIEETWLLLCYYDKTIGRESK